MITFPDEDPWLFQYLPGEGVRGGREPLMMDPPEISPTDHRPWGGF